MTRMLVRKVKRFKSRAVGGINRARRYIPKSKKDRQRLLVLLTSLASFALFTLLGSIFAMVILMAIFSRDLPNPNQLLERSEELSTKLMDRNGEAIYEVFGEKKQKPG